MSSLLHDIVRTGLVSGVASGVAAAFFSRLRTRRAAPAMNAVSHIAWSGPPPADNGPGGRNLVVGSVLHLGAAMFWAAIFESLFGRPARQSSAAACAAGSVTAAAAFLTDYLVVPHRLRPGMEAFLSRRALVGVYATIAAAFALAACTDGKARRDSPRLGLLATAHADAEQVYKAAVSRGGAENARAA